MPVKHIEVRSRVLLTLPPRAAPAVRADGGSVALMVPDESMLTAALLVDGAKVSTLEYVGPARFLPDGELWFTERQGKEWRVNFRGKAGPFFSGINTPQTSADGQHVAYAGTVSKGVMRLVVDHEPRHAEYNVRRVALSGSGGHVAFEAVEAVDSDEQTSRVVVDGQAGRPFAAIGDLAFSPDNVCVYVGEETDGDYRVVEGNKESEPFASVLGVGFTPKGQLWHTFSILRGPRTAEGYVVGGREYASEHPVSHVFFQADDTLAGLLVETKEGQALVRPQKPLLTFLATSTHAFAAPDMFAFVVNTLPGNDPKRFAAPKRLETTTGVTEPFTKIFQLGFPKGTSTISFAAQQGDQLLWCEVDP